MTVLLVILLGVVAVVVGNGFIKARVVGGGCTVVIGCN